MVERQTDVLGFSKLKSTTIHLKLYKGINVYWRFFVKHEIQRMNMNSNVPKSMGSVTETEKKQRVRKSKIIVAMLIKCFVLVANTQHF